MGRRQEPRRRLASEGKRDHKWSHILSINEHTTAESKTVQSAWGSAKNLQSSRWPNSGVHFSRECLTSVNSGFGTKLLYTLNGVSNGCALTSRLEKEQLDLALTGTESLFQIRPRQ